MNLLLPHPSTSQLPQTPGSKPAPARVWHLQPQALSNLPWTKTPSLIPNQANANSPSSNWAPVNPVSCPASVPSRLWWLFDIPDFGLAPEDLGSCLAPGPGQLTWLQPLGWLL